MSTSLNLPAADAAASRSSQAPTIAEATAFPIENGRPVVSVAATKLSHFVLLNPLGAGAMGSVFAAYDEKLDRRVAPQAGAQPDRCPSPDSRADAA